MRQLGAESELCTCLYGKEAIFSIAEAANGAIERRKIYDFY